MPLGKCQHCEADVFLLHKVTTPFVRVMVDIEAVPTGTIAINEMLGTYANIPRPGKIAKRRDLHRLHKDTCKVLSARRREGRGG